eukprot:UC4_evm1s1074
MGGDTMAIEGGNVEDAMDDNNGDNAMAQYQTADDRVEEVAEEESEEIGPKSVVRVKYPYKHEETGYEANAGEELVVESQVDSEWIHATRPDGGELLIPREFVEKQEMEEERLDEKEEGGQEEDKILFGEKEEGGQEEDKILFGDRGGGGSGDDDETGKVHGKTKSRLQRPRSGRYSMGGDIDIYRRKGLNEQRKSLRDFILFEHDIEWNHSMDGKSYSNHFESRPSIKQNNVLIEESERANMFKKKYNYRARSNLKRKENSKASDIVSKISVSSKIPQMMKKNLNECKARLRNTSLNHHRSSIGQYSPNSRSKIKVVGHRFIDNDKHRSKIPCRSLIRTHLVQPKIDDHNPNYHEHHGNFKMPKPSPSIDLAKVHSKIDDHNPNYHEHHGNFKMPKPSPSIDLAKVHSKIDDHNPNYHEHHGNFKMPKHSPSIDLAKVQSRIDEHQDSTAD